MAKKTTKKSATPGTRKAPAKKATKPKPAPKGKATREHVVAQAKADQENARVRDEQAKSPDGMTAKSGGERAMATSASGAVPKPKKQKKASGLDAAAQVLKDAKQPMRCKDIVETMLAKKLWKTDGKTPHATIYAAILREIQTKGADARFKKTDRGLFAFRGK
ncbi:MAG: hypothetical protein GC159_13410 [Phycisphaera sp.]|nr:hypothetical protein [Phycisphaera sp.]